LLTAVVAIGALLVSGLTFFSGFGLGTLLLPFFLVVFDPAVAVAATAVVHLLNNLFKFVLIGRHTVWKVVVVFGLPAAVAAFGGALLLDLLTLGEPLASFDFLGRTAVMTPVKMVLGLLILAFSIFDLVPRFHDLDIDRRWLPLGGILSGFFGGISGHQGAMRATFLVKAGLGREGFIATGIACAVLVDVTRLTVYGATFLSSKFAPVVGGQGYDLVIVATLAAFVGAFVGRRLLHKVTIRLIRVLVGALMLLTGAVVFIGLV
jgi:uncharacterized membrane protein YfcA